MFYLIARNCAEIGWCFVTVIDVYVLTRSVHLNMKTLSISLKFRGHQSSVLTCFLPVTFTVCVYHLQASSSSNLLWLSRTWLKWLLEDCRLGRVQSIFDIIFHAKDAKLKKNKNLLEINHKKMTVNVYDCASAESLENEYSQANPGEWITQDNNNDTSIENTARQFPFVFCTAHRWNPLCDVQIFAHSGLWGSKSIGRARQQTGPTIFPPTSSSLFLWLLL